MIELDNDITETWKAIRRQNQEKREKNREDSTKLLEKLKISFSSHNGGSHLIVYDKVCTVDFWPSTGRWMMRGTGRAKFGVRNLLTALGYTQKEMDDGI